MNPTSSNTLRATTGANTAAAVAASNTNGEEAPCPQRLAGAAAGAVALVLQEKVEMDLKEPNSTATKTTPTADSATVAIAPSPKELQQRIHKEELSSVAPTNPAAASAAKSLASTPGAFKKNASSTLEKSTTMAEQTASATAAAADSPFVLDAEDKEERDSLNDNVRMKNLEQGIDSLRRATSAAVTASAARDSSTGTEAELAAAAGAATGVDPSLLGVSTTATTTASISAEESSVGMVNDTYSVDGNPRTLSIDETKEEEDEIHTSDGNNNDNHESEVNAFFNDAFTSSGGGLSQPGRPQSQESRNLHSPSSESQSSSLLSDASRSIHAVGEDPAHQEDYSETPLLRAELVDEERLRREALSRAAEDWNREMMNRTITADEVVRVEVIEEEEVEEEQEDEEEAKRRKRRRMIVNLGATIAMVIVAGILGGTLSARPTSRGVVNTLPSSSSRNVTMPRPVPTPPTATRPPPVVRPNVTSPPDNTTTAPAPAAEITFPPQTLSPLFDKNANNTRCVDALPLWTRQGYNTYRSTLANTSEQSMQLYNRSCPGDESLDGAFNLSGRWYKFIPRNNAETSVTIRLCTHYLFAMTVVMFRGTCSQLSCVSSSVEAPTFSLYDAVYDSTLYCNSYTFKVTPAVEYMFLVEMNLDSFNTVTPDRYVVTMTTAHDYYPDAASLVLTTMQQRQQGSTVGATPDVDIPLCSIGGGNGYSSSSSSNWPNRTRTTPGVWYFGQVRQGNGTGIRIDTCGSSFPVRVSILVSDRASNRDHLRCVDSVIRIKDNHVCVDGQPAVAWRAEPNRFYFVLFHGDESNITSTQPDPLPNTSGTFFYSTSTFDASCLCHGARFISTQDLVSSGRSSVRGQLSPDSSLGWMGNTDFASRLNCGNAENPVAVKTAGTWYTFQGFGGQLSMSTCNNGTDFDTKISVFKGSCNDLVCIAANDNATASECQNFPGASSVNFTTENGATYFVLVHGGMSNTTTGHYVMTIRQLSCSGIKGPFVADGRIWQSTTVGAARERNMSACGGGGLDAEPSVVFAFYGSGTEMTASTCHNATNFETKLSIMTTSCSDSLWTCFATSDVNSSTWCSGRNSVRWNSSPGELYYVVVSNGSNNSTSFMRGNLSLSVTSQVGETCVNSVGPFSYPFSLFASTPGSATFNTSILTCGAWNHSAPGAWYTLDGFGGNLAVEVCPTQSASLYTTVYSGDCNSPQCITARSNSTCGRGNALVWSTNASQSYRVLVESVTTDSVDSFELSSHIGPGGRNCEQAQLIPKSYFSGGKSLEGSTRENAGAISMTFCGDFVFAGKGLWFEIQGLSGLLNLITCSSSNLSSQSTSYATLGVFAGSCDNLVCVAFGQLGPGKSCVYQSNVTFLATKNATYFIFVGEETEGQAVDFVLNTNILPDDNNIDGIFCDSPLTVAIGEAVNGSLTDRHRERGSQSCARLELLAWYKLTGPVEGLINVNTCTNASKLKHAVGTFLYIGSGTCHNFTCLPGRSIYTSSSSSSCASVSFNASALETYYIIVSRNEHSSQALHGDFLLYHDANAIVRKM